MSRHADDIHVPFVFASLALAVLGGFTLAVSLPVEAALGGYDVGWVSHAQVHGHLQVVGFAGLFVVGVSMKLAPRFASRSDVALASLVTPGFGLMVFGILLRIVGQPLAEHSPFPVLLGAGAFAEAAGALLLAAVLLATLRPALGALDPPALLLGSAACWLAVQGVLGAWWLTELATEGGTILVGTRNSALVNIQFFGVVMGAILGVGMRTFPTFFGAPPTSKPLGRLVFALAAVGVAGWTAGTAWSTPAWLASGGQALVGAAVLTAVGTFGLTSRKHRLAAASSGYVWALRAVMAWLAVTGVVLLWSGSAALLDGVRVGFDEVDAARHIFAVGVVTLAIIAMAQLILPEFASERLVRQPWPHRGVAFAVTLSAAVALRGLAPLLDVEGDLRWWLMAAGGTLGLAGTGAFAFLYARARRGHTAYRRRIAALRNREATLKMADG